MAVIATSTPLFSNVVKAELFPETAYCRKVATVYGPAATLQVGTVLGKFLAGGSATATAGGTNTGDGAMGTITVGGTAKIGTYTLTITKAATNAGDFQVTDPEGKVVGLGTVAAAFSGGGLSFTLADGSGADFAVGDTFTIAVTGTEKYKASIQTATDGTAVADAIVIQETAVALNTDTSVVVLHRGPAAVSKDALILDASYNLAAEKAAVYAALEAKGIKVLDTF